MRALLVPDGPQQLVGDRIARGTPVEAAHLVVLGGLARGEQPVDRCYPRL
jgi:hypothetical protein